MTEIKDDGGPAFPNGVKPIDALEASRTQDGMTLRDWFAGQALIGMCANPDVSIAAAKDGLKSADIRVAFALSAYAVADLMLKARRP